jgi:hypothetical protein
MRKTVALIALAATLPTMALADGDAPRVLELHNAMLRDGRAQQAAEEGRANVQAFQRLQELQRGQRDVTTDGAYAGGRSGAVRRR